MAMADNDMIRRQWEEEDEDDGFPLRLHIVVSQADGGASPDMERILCFLPHGRAFTILDEEVFCNRVLPLLFPEEISWSGFLHQLTLYGFKRISDGPEQGAFYHAFFVQGRPDLARTIKLRPARPQWFVQDIAPEDMETSNLSHFLPYHRSPAVPLSSTTTESATRRNPFFTRPPPEGQRALMFGPTVGATTLPPAQFGRSYDGQGGGGGVLVNLIMAGVTDRLAAENGNAMARREAEEVNMQDVIRDILRD